MAFKLPPTHPQFVEEQGANRAFHIWSRRDDGTFVCVICCGWSRVPTIDGLPEKFVQLTRRERNLGRFIDKDKL